MATPVRDDAALDRRLDRVERRLDRLGQLLAQLLERAGQIAEDVDGIDRQLRPFGDGTKLRRRPR